MDICILRHGIAEDRDATRHPDDGLRPLTPEGRKKLKRISGFLKDAGFHADFVLTSPLVRARQTAEIAARILGLVDKVVETPHLAPEGDPGRLVDEIRRHGKGSVLLVGHEPYLSGFISVLLSGRGDLAIDLKKGGFCRLSAEDLRYGRCARLMALFPPKPLAAARR